MYELNKQRLKIGKIEIISYDGLIEETRGGMVVLNGNQLMQMGGCTAGAIFKVRGDQALAEIERTREQLGMQSPGSVRLTSGSSHWTFVAHAVMTDCRAKLCTIKRSELETETIMSSLIQIESVEGLK